MDKTKLDELGLKLFEINAFKFGDFKMKVGVNSPIYFDLRVIVSYPDVMDTIANLLTEYIKSLNVGRDVHLCGVPYTALPIATLISVKANEPMLIRRKEAKNYGTKKLIEGKFHAGDKCLIIEDVVTSGSSILDTVEDLRSEGLEVTDAIVVVDREQGGLRNVQEKGVKMHSLFTLSYLLKLLLDAGRIERETVQSVSRYIESAQIRSDGSFANGDNKVVNDLNRLGMTFESRARMAVCPITRELMNLIASKKTTLCLAADYTSSEEILNLVEKAGPYICLLKTHVDIIDDYNETFIKSLKKLAEKHNFMIMEDRKFADIGSTAALQYSNGPFRIADWADLVTVHSLPGHGVLKGLKMVLNNCTQPKGAFLLAEMSSQGNLTTPQYSAATMKMATETDSEFVAGIVCQNPDLVTFPGLLQLTPGVKIEEGVDELDQQYHSPEYVVGHKGADICVVGRGILNSKNPEITTKLYRDRLWEAYCQRMLKHDL